MLDRATSDNQRSPTTTVDKSLSKPQFEDKFSEPAKVFTVFTSEDKKICDRGVSCITKDRYN